ncbi:MAG: 30S ribosomal protein S4 [bacterium]
MGGYMGSRCKICRREGTKLFLKGERCYSTKCAVERREYAPGEHGRRRTKLSEYGVQLREKQKLRRTYGVAERQFKNYFDLASRRKGITGEYLLQILERRLDNMVYRMGFANSRAEARQLVCHGHFAVNGRKVDIPSYLTKVGDTISVREKSRRLARIREAMDSAQQRGIPKWLEVDGENLVGKILEIPSKEQIGLPIQEELVVELYSKE